ncbi:uncharacterized protein LOC130756412 [Actinidia eriantha]|uniref:uncharacterized protein LOC130756412 n=1 Tax=Actinidia eriantha TaxID=165200 RepID=UPI002585B407|nr:uncharacterized protein LOC130756412 [Actinidia eriantha]
MPPRMAKKTPLGSRATQVARAMRGASTMQNQLEAVEQLAKVEEIKAEEVKIEKVKIEAQFVVSQVDKLDSEREPEAEPETKLEMKYLTISLECILYGHPKYYIDLTVQRLMCGV